MNIASRNSRRPRGFGIARDDTSRNPVVPDHPLAVVSAGGLRDTFVLAAAAVDEAQGFHPATVPIPASGLLEGIQDFTGTTREAIRREYGDGDPQSKWRRLLADYIYRLPAARLVMAQRAAGGNAAYLDISRDDGAPAHHGAEAPALFQPPTNDRERTVAIAVLELIRTGRVDADGVREPFVAGDVLPVDVLPPSHLLELWEGVPRP
ncbi:hypothetical protein [Microbacterium rhizosphaerae]|uniref:Uncharacterized protein n=1 Tax=Microbacterium rhizosphaerae TaxID=1678237 RepID=A0ABZ0SMF1_9MICO|nr:hypothetical protein [Microbacterium rhizosphaerae]WPR89360.1 hypothetical protein SM116_16605 [Microbacterium rhizosphaerae]